MHGCFGSYLLQLNQTPNFSGWPVGWEPVQNGKHGGINHNAANNIKPALHNDENISEI